MLGGIQQRLQETYEVLATRRRAHGYPVYAIEHGLSPEEVDGAWNAASQAIRYAPPSRDHWLVWCAIASEAGYRYSGDEFWPALERQSGEWRTNDHRQRLRDFYRRFAADFGGPEPVGRWAGHFNIIAWPISGAILPLYLQSHFAQHLFDQRFYLPAMLQADGDQMGELLLHRYDGTSSRFRDFLQQTGLTTQIVLALRDEAHAPLVTRIEPAVLTKIVSDLERRRDAKAYLRDARRAMEKTTVKIASRLQSKTAGSETTGGKSAPAAQFALIARKLPDGRFALGLKFPDFRAAGLTRDVVAGQRIRFAGETDQSWPASNLLSLSGGERRLDEFPSPNSDLITAEEAGAQLAALLTTVARLDERPSWVLRRQVDGAYREVVGGHVRARQDYLVLTRGSPPDELVGRAGLVRTRVQTTGVEAFDTSTPAVLTEDMRAAFKALGIRVESGVTVAPFGLNPRPGSVPSWLTTEPILISASADLDVSQLAISLDGADPMIVPCENARAMVALENMEPGKHSLSIAPVHRPGSGWSPSPEPFSFEIVPPQPWPEAMRDKSGFRLILEPSNASFEMVINGDASLNVFGPSRRLIQWSLVTYDAAGHPGAALPLSTTRLGDPIGTLTGAMELASRKYSDEIDEAYQLDIVANLDELGRQALRFPRVVEPLRWKFDPASGTARLVDETDHEELPDLSTYALSDPLEKVALPIEKALVGLKPDGEGALFVARYKDLTQTVFVSAPTTSKFKDFSSLGAKQNVSLPTHRGVAAMRLIDGMRRWEKAKPVGSWALVRRDMTVRRLREELAALCCGRDFASLLTVGPTALDQAQTKVGGSQGFGFRMRRNEWPADYESAVGSFVHYARHYQVEPDERLVRLALTLAYRPLKLRLDAIDDRKEFLAGLLERHHLLRGAFLAQAVSRSPALLQLKESA